MKGICYHCKSFTKIVNTKYNVGSCCSGLKQYQSGGKKPQKSIPKRTKKRSREEREYSTVKKIFLENNPKCQVKGCKNKSCQVHHKKGRIEKLLTNIKYFLASCDSCHKKIEANPEWAYDEGYSLKRNSKE